MAQIYTDTDRPFKTPCFFEDAQLVTKTRNSAQEPDGATEASSPFKNALFFSKTRNSFTKMRGSPPFRARPKNRAPAKTRNWPATHGQLTTTTD